MALLREGGQCLFVSMEADLGRTVCLGKGCERRTSPSNQLVLCGDGLAWPGLKELGQIFCEGLCESECCLSQQS